MARDGKNHEGTWPRPHLDAASGLLPITRKAAGEAVCADQNDETARTPDCGVNLLSTRLQRVKPEPGEMLRRQSGHDLGHRRPPPGLHERLGERTFIDKASW